jgi:hypothetical protein
MPPEIKPPTTEEIEQALKNGGVLNPEIGDALKEFEVQNVAFEATKIPIKTIAEGSSMVRFLMKHFGDIVKTEKNAQYVLLGVIVLLIAISIFIFARSSPLFNEIPLPPTPFEEGYLKL